MNLHHPSRRMAAISARASEEERIPPLVTVRLPYAGGLALGEHPRGVACVNIVPLEERRQQLAWIHDPLVRDRCLLDESNQQSDTDLARHIDVALKVAGMTSEQMERRMAELLVKMTADGQPPNPPRAP